jgi:hypothetical protein
LSLIYSVKNQNDIPFLGELVKTQQTNPKLYNTFVVSEGSTDKLESVNTENGRITPEVIHKVVGESYQNKTFFICGPPNFMKAMVDILISKGVSADRIITEAFGQGAVHNAGKISSWPNKIYALGAVGIAVASLVVMISDLIKNISASQYSTPTNLVDSTTTTNSRQDELDDLVNKLPRLTNESPVSAAAKAASQPTNATPASPSASTTTTAPAPTPSPVIPTPAPVPKCTTTQSGVTTCV